jgi:tetratricopeptide (TPR) repeat protein
MGAILYEMLTLQPPIDKTGGFWPIILRVSEAQIELPEKKAPERARAGKIPPELAAVAMKALAKEKTDRYQTIEAMHKDIELFQEGRSVSAKQDTFREMLWKLVKRNKGASIATGIALLVLLTVLAVSFQFINAARLRAEVAQNKAEENYQAYAKQVRESAPVLLRTANVALNERQFDDALVQAALAAKSDPDNAEARLLNGKLLITRKRFAEAIPELEEYLKLNRENAFVRKLAELCRTAQAETAESPAETASLLAFAEIFTQAHDHALADGVLSGLGLGKNAVEVRQRMLEMYRKRIDAAWPGKGNLLTISAEGRFSFPGQGAKITDLTPLRGIPLSDLNLDGDDGVWDLAPLKGMPLTSLNLCGCAQVRDLEPLKGMPLTALYLGWCAQVQDLTPLKGMPLTALNLGGCGQVRDLAPLKGMKLTSLVLWGTQLRDLEPLKGMPLREIHLPPNASKGIEVIRAMKTLQSIDGTPPPQFWKVWDAAKAKEK